MEFDVDMFRTLVSLFGFCGCDGSLIVTIEGKGIFKGETNLLEKLLDPQYVE